MVWWPSGARRSRRVSPVHPAGAPCRVSLSASCSGPLLVVDDLRRPGLHSCSLRLEVGECVAVRGPSGAGKSLLLRAIADLDPAQGRVALAGVERESMPAPIWRGQVCYLAAEPCWWSDRVADHFPDWARAAPLARRLGLPQEVGEALVARLSTGERQRLALVRVLARVPRVLLLDEPTAALDGVSRDAVEALLTEWRQGGARAILWVSHDPAQAARVAARQLFLAEGRLLEREPAP
jgi:putative ABC transport system ATP-binding protein